MQRRRIRQLAVFGTAALGLALPTAAFAQATEDTNTTISTAEATAAEIEGVLVIGQTSGDSTGDGEASATALELGGETISGGEQQGEGEQSGELVGTGETPLGEVSVAPYETSVDGDGGTQSSAALVELTLVDEDTAHVTVLGSETQTGKDGSSAHSDAVRITLGGEALDAHVLHADTNSDGESGSALALINDNGIVTDEQTGGVFCPLDAAPLVVADVVCAEAAEQAALGEVADVVLLDGNLPVIVSQAQSGDLGDDGDGGHDGDDGGDGGGASDDGGVAGDETLGAPVGDGALAFTGAPLAALFAAALGSIGSGEALRRRMR